MNMATKVVDDWLQQKHTEVMLKLKKRPELQLNYLTRVLTEKAKEIEGNEKSESIIRSDARDSRK